MKLSLTFSSIITSFILLQGCGSEENKTSTTKINTATINKSSQTIEGKTTLSSGTRSETKATVCLDRNRNERCNSNEEQVFTMPDGSYKLTIYNGIKNGDMLLVMGGISNLVNEHTNKLNTLTLGKIYNELESSQNINVISSLISNEVDKGLSYDDAVKKIAQKYNLPTKILLSNPLDNANDFFGKGREFVKITSALEIIFKAKEKSQVQKKFFDDVLDFVGLGENNTTESNSTDNNSSLLPSLDEVNDTIDTYSTTFSDFFDSLNEYYDNFVGWLYSGDIDEDEEANLTATGFLFPIPLNREELNGAWYISDESNDATCTHINKYNDVTIFEADGNVTSLSLSVDGNLSDIRILDFTYGFISSDKITISAFYGYNHSFKGQYISDGEKFTAKKILTLRKCKEKLGLGVDPQ